MPNSSALAKKRGKQFSRWPLQSPWVWIFSLGVLCLVSLPPLTRFAARMVLSAGASVFGLRLQATVHGNVFSQLRITDIRLTPCSDSHPFLKVAELHEFTLDYDLRRLRGGNIWRVITGFKAHGGLFHFRHATVGSEPAQGSSPGSHVDTVLRTICRVPRRFSAEVDIQNVSANFDGDFPLSSISDFNLVLPRGRPGNLQLGKITFANGAQLGPLLCEVNSGEEQINLGPLKITPEIQINALRIGTTDRAGKLSAAILLGGVGGTLQFSITEQDTGWHGIASGKNFNILPLLDTLELNRKSIPDCKSIEIEVVGTPLDIRTWRGTASIELAHQTSKGGRINSEINATLALGELKILSGRLFSKSSNLLFNGSIRNDAAKISAASILGTVSMDGTLEDFSEWFPELENELRGQAQLAVHAELQKGMLILRPRIVGGRIDASHGTHWVRAAALSTEGEIRFPIRDILERGIQKTTTDETSVIKFCQADFNMTTAEAKIGGPSFQISTDATNCSFKISDGLVKLTSLLIVAGSNKVSGALEFNLSKKDAPAMNRIRADLQARCPLIRGEMLQIAGHFFTGSVEAKMQAQFSDDTLDGSVEVLGSNMRWGRCGIPLVRMNATGDGRDVVIHEFLTSLGTEQSVQLSGRTETKPPYAYNLKAQLILPNLVQIQPFISQAGLEGKVSGQIEGSWSGAGRLTDLSGTGECKLRGRDLRWNSLEIQSVDFGASYEPGMAQIHELQIASRDTRLRTEAKWSNKTLALSKISLQQKGRDVLTGELDMPLTWDGASIRWVKDGRIAGVLSGTDIELGSVLRGLDSQSPVTGSATFALNLSGTPDAPLLDFVGRGKTMKTRNYPRLAGCDFHLQARHENRILHCEVVMHSALGAPLRMDAQASFTFEDLFARKINWNELPIEGSLRIEHAKLHVLPALLPQLRDVKGTGSIQARMGGSVGNPVFEGALKLDCETLRFETDRIPAITDLHVSLRVDREHLHVERIRADLGGGSLTINGVGSFLEPRNPHLSMNIKAQQVLVQRTEQLSLRLDGDLQVNGQWDAAAVRGELYAVKSMVRRDIELLPISAMQSGGSGYKRPPGKPWFMFPRKPFSDWKLDVHLATKPGDPVLIRGNRLRGTAKVDVRLLGTGAAPTLDGSYVSDDVIALLPFARVEVSRGRVWYSAGAPFLSQTEFTAESEIRNHRIRMYLHGPPENPQISVSSDPPLAERDALTLLTAGVLPGDFASESSQAASSRAAALLMQEFSDKVLLKDGGSERFSALRRFSLDVGALNSRTGNQETRLTYRLQDNVFVIGEIGANGDFATRLRYAFRFY
jgi:hypothetical protein